MVTNLLGEERGLHGIDWDGYHSYFNEGGPASHWMMYEKQNHDDDTKANFFIIQLCLI